VSCTRYSGPSEVFAKARDSQRQLAAELGLGSFAPALFFLPLFTKLPDVDVSRKLETFGRFLSERTPLQV
jgi:hypothetical protein